MTNNVFDLINSTEIGTYWTELINDQPPYLGEGLFPNKLIQGLSLRWIKGASKLPVRLRPSHFDTKPTLRDRQSLNLQHTEMPFFRESMQLGEYERQQLLALQASQTSQALVNTIMTKIYDDAATLISGAVLIPEMERMQLLQTGAIAIASEVENVSYEYDYDETGAWKASNFIQLAGDDVWTSPGSRKVRDLMEIKRAASRKGITLTRGILSPEVWLMLLEDPQINLEMYPQGGSNIVIDDSTLSRFLTSKLGITFTVYDKHYNDGTEDQAFMQNDRIVLLPPGPVGTTYWGTTPEQADLMANPSVNVTVVNTGVAVATKVDPGPPVNHLTWVSEIVLPSYEGMDQVYVLKVV